MSYNLSECQNFLEVDDMEFMAFQTNLRFSCDDCYFLGHGLVSACHLYPRSSNTYCSYLSRFDKRDIIWMRIE